MNEFAHKYTCNVYNTSYETYAYSLSPNSIRQWRRQWIGVALMEEWWALESNQNAVLVNRNIKPCAPSSGAQAGERHAG